MDGTFTNAGLRAAVKTGLICGLCVAAIELYYIVLGLASSSISQPIYQTLWLLVAFLFAMAGIWAVRMAAGSVRNVFSAALYSGLAGAVAGALYVAAVIVVGLVDSLYYMQYGSISSILGTVFGVIFGSVLWIPVAVAVSVAGGVIYATLTNKV